MYCRLGQKVLCILYGRVRDEIRMTIAAYQTLYESSVAFGMRKSLMSEQGKVDMEENIGQLELEKRDLEQQVNSATSGSTNLKKHTPYLMHLSYR